MASKTGKQDGFEAQYKTLEETVSKLEQGDLTLEESLALYEEGMKLAKRCQELLRDAELRVTRLQEQFSDGLGAIREEEAEYDPVSDESDEHADD
ncbi:MAG: exodeoxyribonuclease VII small subunit [Dehalococcoidia bacterium]